MTAAESRAPSWKTATLMFLGVIALWALVAYGFWLLVPSWSVHDELGDIWTAVGSFITALAFAGLLYTIRQQRHELEQNTAQLQAQAEEFRLSNAMARQQMWESTFFQLLRLHRELTDSLEVRRIEDFGNSGPRAVVSRGRDVFREFLQDARENYGDRLNGREVETLSIALDAVSWVYGRKYEAIIGAYLRTLTSTLRFVANSPERSTRPMFADLVRAQLSGWELDFLYYFGLSYRGREIKPLLEALAILAPFRPESLLDPSKHWPGDYQRGALYPNEATFALSGR